MACEESPIDTRACLVVYALCSFLTLALHEPRTRDTHITSTHAFNSEKKSYKAGVWDGTSGDHTLIRSSPLAADFSTILSMMPYSLAPSASRYKLHAVALA